MKGLFGIPGAWWLLALTHDSNFHASLIDHRINPSFYKRDGSKGDKLKVAERLAEAEAIVKQVRPCGGGGVSVGWSVTVCRLSPQLPCSTAAPTNGLHTPNVTRPPVIRCTPSAPRLTGWCPP